MRYLLGWKEWEGGRNRGRDGRGRECEREGERELEKAVSVIEWHWSTHYLPQSTFTGWSQSTLPDKPTAPGLPP